MNSKKDITITTSAFTITIHWNGQVVSAQLAILVGVILLKLMSHNSDVSVLCNVLLLLDFISILACLFMGGKVSTDGEKGESKKQPEQTSVEEPAKKEIKNVSKHSSTSEKDRTIKKKVPIPEQKGVVTQEAPIHEEPTAETKNEPNPVEQPTSEDKEEKPVSEMTEEEFNNLFNW